MEDFSFSFSSLLCRDTLGSEKVNNNLCTFQLGMKKSHTFKVKIDLLFLEYTCTFSNLLVDYLIAVHRLLVGRNFLGNL